MQAKFSDLAGLVGTGKYGNASTNVTAGGGADGTAINGNAIDLSAMDKPESLTAFLPLAATLAATQTLTTTFKWQVSADGSSGWTDLTGKSGTLDVLTGASGGSTEVAVSKTTLDLNFSEMLRYVRLVLTPTMSAGSTDTAVISPAAIVPFGEQHV